MSTLDLTPERQEKALHDAIVQTRRRERQNLRTAKDSFRQKELRAAHAAADAAQQRNDPASLRRLIKRQWVDSLAVVLEERLRAQLRAIYWKGGSPPALSFELGEEEGDEVIRKVLGRTDWKTIWVNIRGNKVPGPFDSADEIAQFTNAVRGVLLHEAGHLLHTIWLGDLLQTALKDVDLRARYANQFGVVNSIVAGEQNGGGPQINPQLIDSATMHLKHVWNVVEDQRMERIMRGHAPRIPDYFRATFARFIVPDGSDSDFDPDDWWASSWLLIAGRTHLDKEVRDYSRDLFPEGAERAAEWRKLLFAYMRATTPERLAETLLDCYQFIMDCDSVFVMHEVDELNDHQMEAGSSEVRNSMEERAEAGGEPDDGEGEADDDTVSAGADGERVADVLPFEDVIKKLNFTQATEADHLMIEQALAEARRVYVETLPMNESAPMSAELVRESYLVADGVVQALETYLTQYAPTWQIRQSEGVIDPLDYRARDVGEDDYHLNLSGDLGRSFDLHVSVLVDRSTSMRQHMTGLSVVLYGMKMAVDRLGIDNNFTVWSSDGETYSIYSEDDEPRVIFANGGTQPSEALNDALSHNKDHAHHLVFILTDGAWYDVDTLLPWKMAEESKFVLVRWGAGPKEIIGADDEVDLEKISDLPWLLRDSLDNLLGGMV